MTSKPDRKRWVVGILAGIVVAVLGVATLLVGLEDEDELAPTPDERRASTITGFFLFQEIQARRCDEFLTRNGLPNTPSQMEFHQSITGMFQRQLSDARNIRQGYYRRLHGRNWKVEMDKTTAEAIRRIEGIVHKSVPGCRNHADEMDRRLTLGWDYVERKIRGSLSVDRPDQMSR